MGVGGGGVYNKLTIDTIDGFPVDSRSTEFDPAFQAIVGLRLRLDERNEIGASYKFLMAFAKDVDYIGTHSLSLVYVHRF